MKFLKIIPLVLLLFLVPAMGTFAGGAQEAEAPTLELPAQPRQYISPENGDGTQDILTLPFSSVVVPAEEMVIVAYELSVYDADGMLVFSVAERQDERRSFFGNLFGGEKPRVEVPDTLTWDGTWSVADDVLPDGVSNGDLVADGEYTYQLTVIDDAGNFARSAPFNVTVDNTAPQVGDLQDPEYEVFSPNDDGVRDTVSFPLVASRELVWVVEIVDEAGDTVFSEEFRNDNVRRPDLDPAPPAQFSWDGSTGTRSEPGPQAPEGRYSLVLTGRDRAGNETRAEHPGVVTLSLRVAELVVSAVETPAVFSPNGDGRRDTLSLSLSASDPDSIRRWTLEILNRNQVVRSVSGTGAPPPRWEFDGMREDGSRLSDGSVTARLSARLDNGNEVASAPFTIAIDTEAPQAALTATTAPRETEPGRPLIFGAGDKRRMEGSITYEAGIPWTYVLSHDGEEIASGELSEFFSLVGVEPQSVGDGERARVELIWSGQAIVASGPAADGTYRLVLTGEDPAGNRGETRPLIAVKDRRTPEIGLRVEGEFVSPLSRGAFQSATFRTEYGAPELIDEFLFEVRNQEDRMVRSSYQRRGFNAFEWNGLSNGGTVVPDGPYTGRLQVRYQNGHVATVEGVGPVIVDRTSPEIRTLTVEPRRFSPDDDGEADEVLIRQEVAPGDTWNAELTNEAGETVLTWRWEDTVEPIEWDGRDASGRIVADGDYRYVLRSTDRAGNATEEDLLITVDTEPAAPPVLRVSLRPQPFSPDDDGREDSLNIHLRVEGETTITGWSAVIRDPDGRPFKRFSGAGTPPSRIVWDGRSDDGRLVETARQYPLSVTIRDDVGHEVTEEAVIEIDILVIRDGDRLRIRVSNINFAPFTPDLFLSDEQQLDTNLETLRRLATILNRYPEREIIIEGHAAHVYLDGPAQQREQEQVLLPLSRARATEVMQALMILGVDRNRMSIEAYGGDRPVVPHADRDAMWRNRRVEFLLQRPGR